jgi:hypothetical protein
MAVAGGHGRPSLRYPPACRPAAGLPRGAFDEPTPARHGDTHGCTQLVGRRCRPGSARCVPSRARLVASTPPAMLRAIPLDATPDEGAQEVGSPLQCVDGGASANE